MEERQAIARLQRGDLIGLEVLIKRYQVQAVHAAALIVQDKAIAEDIVQDAFITAAEKIHQFDPQRPFGPWFFRSVVNASIKAAERQSQLVSLEDKQEGDDVTLGDLLTDPQPQPEEWFEQEEVHIKVWRALDRLSPEQKAVIVMHHFLEMSESEMVEQLQRPKSTIKYWLRVAREKLRRFLNPWSATQEPPPGQSHLMRKTNKKGVWYE
jgi:RNA polymerase sigma-70 factor (ECF subfamily)